MKIALAIENFSLYGGGAEAYAVQLARTLVSEGWEVHLFGYSWDGVPEEAVFHPISRLPRWFPPSFRIVHFALTHKKMVRREDFDVVLGFGNTLVMNVYQSHGGVHYQSSVRKLNAVRSGIARSFKKIALFSAPKYYARAWIESAPFRMQKRPVIIAISEMVRQDMAEHFGIKSAEIRLVYNGIDTAKVAGVARDTRSQMRQALGLEEEVVFLFMAYDFRKKGVRYLIEAAGRLRDMVGSDAFRVLVVGGSPSPSLTRLVRRLGPEKIVSFPGATRTPETMYSGCDVFVLPTFYDACSLVVFEAMAAGLPVITTAFNGAAGIITQGVDGTVLSDPRDTREMALAMQRFLDPDHLASMSEAARATAQDYTLEINHKQMLGIFNEVAREGTDAD